LLKIFKKRGSYSPKMARFSVWCT